MLYCNYHSEHYQGNPERCEACAQEAERLTLHPVTFTDATFLYRMLGERTADQSISHRGMPTFDEHCAFMCSNPYAAWYIVETDKLGNAKTTPIGHVYLTKHDEVGVFITSWLTAKGFGMAAVRKFMQMHKRDRYLANINPNNAVSQKLFGELGFKPIQHTYELRTISGTT